MKTLHVVFLLTLSFSIAQCGRQRRGVYQLQRLTICMQPSVWPAIAYADYGCYCGFGGSGTPVDDTDRCCQVHDQCFSKAMQHPDCWTFFQNPYTLWYLYTCDKAKKKITCDRANGTCKMFVCECDRKAAECFAVSSYSINHRHWPREKCQ